jgi:hypothetical protein
VLKHLLFYPLPVIRQESVKLMIIPAKIDHRTGNFFFCNSTV